MFNIFPIYSCKLLWDFCRKCNCDIILAQWRRSFQASDYKGKNFLELCDDNLFPLIPSTIKGGLWLQHFGHLNTLCTRATKTIINYAPMREYHLRFFPKDNFSYLYSLYSIKSRRHILYKYRRFNKYWNLRRDSIGHFCLFLTYNTNTLYFEDRY